MNQDFSGRTVVVAFFIGALCGVFVAVVLTAF